MKNPSSMLPTRTTSQPVPKGNPTKFLVEPGPNIIIIKNSSNNAGTIQITQSAIPITFTIDYIAFDPTSPLTEYVSKIRMLSPDTNGEIEILNTPENGAQNTINVLITNQLS
jgi:hypothetical protein